MEIGMSKVRVVLNLGMMYWPMPSKIQARKLS